MNEFGISRKEASTPLIVFFTLINLTGILVGPVGQKYGIRFTIVAGSLLGGIGFAACFFATDIHIVTISLGIFGCGYGFCFTLISVTLNHYFSDNRASVNGLVFSGPCVGSFVFPPLYEFLFATYGLRGGLLIMSGLVFQVCVFGSLIRSPQYQSNSIRPSFSSTIIESIDEPYTTAPLLRGSENDKETMQIEEKHLDKYIAIENVEKFGMRKLFKDVKFSRDLEQKKQIVKSKKMKNINKKMEDMLIADTEINKNVPEGSIDKVFSGKLCPNDYKMKRNRLFTHNLENNSNDPELYELSSDISRNQLAVNNGGIDTLQLTRPLSILEAFKFILSCRAFYFFSLAILSYYFTYQMIFVIKKDFLIDKGVADADTKYMFFSFSIFDLLGRISIGWITDRNYLKRSQFFILSMTMTAILFFSFPFAGSFLTLNLITSAYGLLFGAIYIMSKVMTLDFLPSEVQEVAFGCIHFFIGTTTLTYIFLIEYFRDKLGSYTNMFFLLASMTLVASLLWTWENCRKVKIQNKILKT